MRSSGKKGKRKTRMRKMSRLRLMTSRYLSDTRWLTNLSAKERPSTRASQNTSMDPPMTAAAVSRKEVQAPNSTAPASAVMLLGMGAMMTESNWIRK